MTLSQLQNRVFKILLKELKKFNPELLDKKRVLAVTKSDLLDNELEEEMRKDILKRLKGKNKTETIFISSATGKNIQLLKDVLWLNMNLETKN